MPVAEPRAVVDGFGGAYTVAFTTNPARIQLYDQAGARVYPERDGSFAVQHPDDVDPPIIAFLSAREIHEAGWGRPCAEGTVTENRVVYDTKGRKWPVVTKPVGWNKAPQPAVQIGDSLVLIDDLWKAAWGGGGGAGMRQRLGKPALTLVRRLKMPPVRR